MKSLVDYINEAKSKYHPKTKKELKDIIKLLIKNRGNEADLNDIDTSDIDDMSGLFLRSNFNGNIYNWDVSKVKDMSYMFADSKFNGDIEAWDVRNVERKDEMFKNSPLEKNPPKWYK